MPGERSELQPASIGELCVNKACFVFPRWEVIADYMNTHSTSGMKRTAKDVINKAKNLQRLGKLTKKPQLTTVLSVGAWML